LRIDTAGDVASARPMLGGLSALAYIKPRGAKLLKPKDERFKHTTPRIGPYVGRVERRWRAATARQECWRWGAPGFADETVAASRRVGGDSRAGWRVPGGEPDSWTALYLIW